MVTSTKPPANAFVAHARKVYNPIGFAKVEYLDFWGVFCNPNEGTGQGALPGDLLACFQFVPVIRHKVILVHRINGYIVTLLSFVGTAAALVIGRRSAGGGVDVQLLFGVLAICFLGSLVIGIINIKRLQIEQHRAWMIRAWAFGGVIITLRIGLIIGAIIVSSIGGYYFAEPCDKISYALGGQDATLSFYPECASFFSGENLDQQAVVKANYIGNNTIEVGAAFNIVFGPAGWLAIAPHAFGAELYLRLTPAEHDRLRNKNPGRAGLTADRLGDAARWTPKSAARSDSDGGETLKEAAEVPFLSNNRS
ncbi:hypothetical protein F5Y01DRAFT_304261 [Xylaria sp. FL0043]|nr:hypothetical protein F5Y01DRAFT_304261 [Xylaria sp. FL0043]